MGWWKRLKAWQKGAVLLGGTHILLYFFLVILLGDYWVAWIIEYPWLYLLDILGMRSLLIFPLGFLIGTAFYALIGAVCGWIAGWISKRG